MIRFCFSQVLVRNVPADPDETISESVEHFFLVNHPDHYLTHQVIIARCSERISRFFFLSRVLFKSLNLNIQVVYNANDLADLVEKKKSTQNWLDYYQLKHIRNKDQRPRLKVIDGFF